MVDEEGYSFGGTPGFTPRHYDMEVEVSTKEEQIDVSCRVTLESLSGVRHSVALTLDSDLVVTEVLDASGNALFHYRAQGGLWIFPGQPVAPGERLEVEIRYGGVLLEKAGPKTYVLTNTTGWYPRVSLSDLATYDVAIAFPKNYDLVASGKTTSVGSRGKLQTHDQQFEQPAQFFTFEVGDYEIEYFDVDHIRVTMAWDHTATRAGDDLEDSIKEVIGHTLRYYEKTFGEYPFDSLTVVTAPRNYSQSLPGFITLSSSITTRQNIFDALFLISDPRLVIAHEIAHQWWGHIVMWGSYRDQWISEAMATYSATAWMHAAFRKDQRPVVDLTARWKISMNDRTEGQRTVDSLGPLILGGRLNSSHYPAYTPIVYEKGGVVLNTLAEAYGEEAFLKILNRVVEVSRGKVVSTDRLLEIIERTTGQDLTWFRDRYVYGTGIPRVYYSYEIEPRGEKTWNVSIDLEQQATFVHRYKLIRQDDRWDFEVSSERMFDTDSNLMAIPVQIRVKKDEDKKRRKRKRKTIDELAEEVARAMTGEGQQDREFAEGKIVLKKTVDTVEFDLPFEPDALWLDRRSDVYGTFFDSSRWPKGALEWQAIAAESEGDYSRAAELFGRALEAPYYVPLEDEEYDPDDDEETTRARNARIHIHLAELYLRTHDDARAVGEIEAVEALPKRFARPLRERIEVARSRLDLHRGDYGAVVQRLRPRLRGYDRMRLIAGYAVLAVAAHETGNDQVYEKAARIAERNGVDITALRDLHEDAESSP